MSLFLNYRAIGVTKEGDRITSVIVKHIESGEVVSLTKANQSAYRDRYDSFIITAAILSESKLEQTNSYFTNRNMRDREFF